MEARKSRVIFPELFFRVTKKPSYDVIFRKLCPDFDVINNFVTRFFSSTLTFRVIFKILTRKILHPQNFRVIFSLLTRVTFSHLTTFELFFSLIFRVIPIS